MRRRTLSTRGGEKAGRGCLALFALPFLGFGLFALGFAGKLLIDHARTGSHYVETICEIVGKRLVESHDSDGSTYRPEFTFTFNAGGETVEATGYSVVGNLSTGDRRGSARALARFEVGGEYPCWYDPRDPGRAVLTRAFPTFPFAMMLLFGVIFSAIGGGLLLGALGVFGRSSRSRPMKAGGVRLPLPSVPKAMPPAGTMRPVRPDAGLAAKAIGLLVFSLFWNGIVSIFVVVTIREWMTGGHPWFQTIFLVPFVAIGLFVAALTVHQFLVAGTYRGLLVQMDRQLAHPGDRIRVSVRHSGQYVVDTWNASVVCREKVRYTRGTETHNEDRVVYEQAVDEAAGLPVSPARPLQREFSATIPREAMHSFDASCNKIVWSIRLKAEVPGRADLDVEYPVLVYPRGVRDAEGGNDAA